MGRRFRRFEVLDVVIPGLLVLGIVGPLAYGLNERYMWIDFRKQATLDEMRRHAKSTAEYDKARLMLDRLCRELGGAHTACWESIVDTYIERRKPQPRAAAVRALALGYEGAYSLWPYTRSCGDVAVVAMIYEQGVEEIEREWAALGEQWKRTLEQFNLDRERDRVARERERRAREREWAAARERQLLEMQQRAVEIGEAFGNLLRPPQEAQPPSIPFSGGGDVNDSGYWRRRLREGY